jgi:hypothetical protein
MNFSGKRVFLRETLLSKVVVHVACCGFSLFRFSGEQEAPLAPPWLAFQRPTPRIAMTRLLDRVVRQSKRFTRDRRT